MRILLFLLLVCVCPELYTQNKEHKIYLLDSAWHPTTDKKNYHYLLAIEKEHDSLYHHWYYARESPLMEYQSFKDEKGEIPNGIYAWYNKDGKIDSSGTLKNGLRHGDWIYYNTNGRYPDSVIRIDEYKDGRKIMPIKIQEPKLVTKDTYPKVGLNWVQFLQKNLHYPTVAQQLNISGEVVVNFQVTKEGNITQTFLAKSVDYFLDTEAIRVIQLTDGKWIPGKQNDVPVKTYHQQKITFVLPD